MKKTWIAGFFLLGALAFGVYQVEYEVREMRSELEGVNKQILAGEEDIHVLDAEWVYLNRPERLKELAQAHLSMQNVSYAQVKNLDTLRAPTAVADAGAQPKKATQAASLAYVTPRDVTANGGR
ncbi:MAG: hypothetical protein EB060_02700 [Proteobacteria bacterium]|nr:hypothetical protein [Pseudomonadota bacterium]